MPPGLAHDRFCLAHRTEQIGDAYACGEVFSDPEAIGPYNWFTPCTFARKASVLSFGSLDEFLALNK
jgi:hypothetical protein